MEKTITKEEIRARLIDAINTDCSALRENLLVHLRWLLDQELGE